MQLNVYVPKSRAAILEELDRFSRESGRQKNDLVLEALERYLSERPREPGSYHLGAAIPWRRADLYEDRLNRAAKLRDPA